MPMVIFEIGADETDFGEMICQWDDDAARMYVRTQAEPLYRMLIDIIRPYSFESITETQIQRYLDDLSAKADRLFEKYAAGFFFQAQARLVSDVLLKVMQDIPGEIKLRFPLEAGGQIESTMAEFLDMQPFKDLRQLMSELFKTRHNEMLGIRRGRQRKVPVESIIERLRNLPKTATLTRLEAEMNLPQRTIQHTLKAAGLTFAAAKKKAKAQE